MLTQLIIATEIGYLSCSAFAELESECLEISRMLSRLIAARSINCVNNKKELSSGDSK